MLLGVGSQRRLARQVFKSRSLGGLSLCRAETHQQLIGEVGAHRRMAREVSPHRRCNALPNGPGRNSRHPEFAEHLRHVLELCDDWRHVARSIRGQFRSGGEAVRWPARSV